MSENSLIVFSLIIFRLFIAFHVFGFYTKGMFYYRKEELEKLRAVYHDDRPQAIAIYGRRRTGKSELIRESFRREKDLACFYFLCDSDTYLGNLRSFAKELAHFLSLEPDSIPTFSSFHQAFLFFQNPLKIRKTIIAIDEFPYLSKKKENSEVAHEFQKIIESDLSPTKTTLILCGSSIRYMKETTENYSSPLYGRFREILQIKPFTYEEVADLFPHYEPFDRLSVFAATGGIAEYVFFFKDYPTFKDAIIALFLTPSGRLLEETSAFLNAEFTEPAVYSAILKRLAGKAQTMPAISSAVGIVGDSLYPYVEKLKSLFIVEEYQTAFNEKKRETRYWICDPFFRFYYGFIDPHRSQISLGDPQILFDDIFAPGPLHTALGRTYERAVIRSVLVRLAQKRQIPFVPETLLPWIGQIKTPKGDIIESEIDLCCYDSKNIIIGECKAKNEPLGIEVYQRLVEKIPFVHFGNRKITILLASFTSFTPEVLKLKDAGVLLIQGSQLIS